MKNFLIHLILSSFVFWSCKERNKKEWENAKKEQNSTLIEEQFQPVGFPFLVRFKIRQFFILYQNFILC